MGTRYRPAAPTRGARVGAAILTVPALLAVVLVGWLLLSPRQVAYHLSADTLHLEVRLGGIDLGKKLSRAELGEASRVQIRRGPRYAGTGLPDLCEGLWDHQPVGQVYEASTCGTDVVVILRPADRPLLITPADPDAFLADLSSGAVGDHLAAPGEGKRAWVGWVSWLAMTFAMAVTVLMVLSPRRLVFEILPGALVIHSLWGRRSQPLAGASVEPLPTSGPWLRLFGLGLPGHQVGRYRVGGRSMDLYLSNRSQALLFVPATGRPVLLSPTRRGDFLAALAAQGVAVDPSLQG